MNVRVTTAYCPSCGTESRYGSTQSAIAAAEAHAKRKRHAVDITLPDGTLHTVYP